MEIKQIIKKHRIKIIFALIGGIAGFLYWKFVGCSTGTCRIKSVWYLMTIYGLFFGYLIGDILSGFLSRREKTK